MSFIAENPLLLAEVEGIPRRPFGGTRGIYAGKDGFYIIDDEGNVDKVVAGKDITEIIDNLNSLYYYGDMNIKPSDSSLFKFAINEDGETASVIGLQNSADSIDKLEYLAIPYEYTDENKKTYRITTIGDGEISSIKFNTSSTIIIPNSVIDIKQWSFNACKKIKKIIFTDNITSIGINAFSTCDGLTDIILPNNLTAISIGVFDTCSNLTSVTIPNSVTKIESGAFFQCDNLTDIYFKGTKEQWESITIIGNDNEPLFNATIHYNWCDGSSGSGGSGEGEKNVQSDWNETNETSDAFIKNKPVVTIDCRDWSNWQEDSKNLQSAGFYKLVNLPHSGAGEYVFLIVQNFNESYGTLTQWAITHYDILYRWATDESGDLVWTDWDTLYASKTHKHSYEDLTDKPTIPVVEQSYDAESENAQSGTAVAQAIAQLVGSAPDTLNTLEELADALKDNANIVDVLNEAIGQKVDKVDGKELSSNDFTDALFEKLSNFDIKFVDYDGMGYVNYDELVQAGNRPTLYVGFDGGITPYYLLALSVSADYVWDYQIRCIAEAYGHLNLSYRKRAADSDTPNWSKWISYVTADDIEAKVDKVEGKGLSTNDFTDEDKEKLENINLDFIITGNVSFNATTLYATLSDMSHTYDDLYSAYIDGKNLKVNISSDEYHYEASLTKVYVSDNIGWFIFVTSPEPYVICRIGCGKNDGWVITIDDLSTNDFPDFVYVDERIDNLHRKFENYATIEYVNNVTGDAEIALDNIIAQQDAIIAIQNSLIGGDDV